MDTVVPLNFKGERVESKLIPPSPVGLNRVNRNVFEFDPAGRVYNCNRTFSPDWNYRWKHFGIMENRQKLR